jgi:hypothetical protein
MARRRNAEEQFQIAMNLVTQDGTISLDPESAASETEITPGITITERPSSPLVITPALLFVPCACGRRLHMVTSRLLIEGWQCGVHYRGVCLVCGWREAIYPVSHDVPSEEQIAAIEEVFALRRTP